MNEKRLPGILVAPGELPPYLLLPGDPARAARIAQRLDSSEVIAKNREFHSYRGSYKGVPVGVLSTGIGAPSAAIACEEAIRAGARVLIRVGTAGALQDEVRDGDLVIALGAARSEGTTPRLLPIEMPALAHPEVAAALYRAAKAQGVRVHQGTVVTLDAFYRGTLDLGLETYSRAGALAVEMECSAVFCVAALRGHGPGPSWPSTGTLVGPPPGSTTPTGRWCGRRWTWRSRSPWRRWPPWPRGGVLKLAELFDITLVGSLY